MGCGPSTSTNDPNLIPNLRKIKEEITMNLNEKEIQLKFDPKTSEWTCKYHFN